MRRLPRRLDPSAGPELSFAPDPHRALRPGFLPAKPATAINSHPLAGFSLLPGWLPLVPRSTTAAAPGALKMKSAPAPSASASHETKIAVRCHHCGTWHETFDHAASTSCPGCGRSISLEDITLTNHSCRTIDTRGHLRIERTGNLYSPLTVCGEGTILGTISGELHCEGRLTLQVQGSIPAKIEATEVVVPAGAEVRCAFPIRAARIIVRGKLLANAVVRQELHILKKGAFEGSVWSRSVQVDRGGELLGSVHISPTEAPEAGLPPARENFALLQSALRGRHARRRPIY